MASYVVQPYNNNGLVGFTGNIDGTNIFLNGDGTYTNFGGGGRNVDLKGNISDLDLDGRTLITNDGSKFSIGTQNRGFLGLDGQTWGAIAGGLQGLSGLASAYTGYKNYQLAKDQFNFQKGLANRNLANQAKIINNTYDNAAQVAAGMIGGRDSSGNYGFTDQAIVDRYAANARKKHVDGSAID